MLVYVGSIPLSLSLKDIKMQNQIMVVGCGHARHGSKFTVGHHGFIGSLSEQPTIDNGYAHSTMGYIPKQKYLTLIKDVENVVSCVSVDGYYDRGEKVACPNEDMASLISLTVGLNRYCAVAEQLYLYTDNTAVIEIIEGKLQQAVENGYQSNDGKPIQNKEQWMAFYNAYRKTVDSGVKVKVLSTNNFHAVPLIEIANQNAHTSLTKGEHSNIITEAYWKVKKTKPPAFCMQNVLHFTNGERRPGEYGMVNYDKDMQNIGKGGSDSTYASVVLEEPEPYLEEMLDYLDEMAGVEYRPIAINVDVLYRPVVRQAIERYGFEWFFSSNPNNIELKNYVGVTLAKETRPMGMLLHGNDFIDFLRTGPTPNPVIDITGSMREGKIVTSKLTRAIKTIAIDHPKKILPLTHELPSKNQLMALVKDCEKIEVCHYAKSNFTTRYYIRFTSDTYQVRVASPSLSIYL